MAPQLERESNWTPDLRSTRPWVSKWPKGRGLGPLLRGLGPLLGPHPVVLGVVGQLGETERLHQRRHVHPEPPAIALAQPVPAAHGVRGLTPPGFDRARLG